jgi:spermidine synthase
VILYAAAILLSAFLLFQVQPLIGKAILPWFGGSAMAWTASMMFFQGTLLAGYAYAHWLAGRTARSQRLLHIALLLVSIATLPVLPGDGLQPASGAEPITNILRVLAASVGLPFFLLATTGPLLQSWFATRYPGRVPYRLYALSNAGSLAALLAYPLLIEPRLTLPVQSTIWSGLYILFVIAAIATARQASRVEPEESEPAPLPTIRQRLTWVALPATASLLLLTVTSHISENVSSIPLLWILPLALYLLTFTLAFEDDRWYPREFIVPLAALAAAAMAYPFWDDLEVKRMAASIAAYAAGLFICCLFCHGETARQRPHPRFLTQFYLSIATGGAIGGVLAGIAAPLLLEFNYDFSLALALFGATAFAAIYREQWWTDIIWCATAIFLAATVYQNVWNARSNNIALARGFYAALRIQESGSDFDASRIRTLVHGTTSHGAQFVNQKRSRTATTYYSERSGVGVAINELARPKMRVGVIGLGAGTLAVYSKPGDEYRFYELNPQVLELAHGWFSFLRDAEGKVQITLGDARLSLEREPPNGFQVLAVDAFASDSIPVHLLTRQALELYFRHLAPDGVLALHISNKYLDLYPVAARAAQSLGKDWLFVSSRENTARQQFGSDWILLANSPTRFDTPAFRAAGSKPEFQPGPPWTDTYSNLIEVLR